MLAYYLWCEASDFSIHATNLDPVPTTRKAWEQNLPDGAKTELDDIYKLFGPASEA